MQVPTEDWLVDKAKLKKKIRWAAQILGHRQADTWDDIRDRKEDDLQLATVQKWFQGAHTPHKRYWKRLRHYIARANKRNSSG